MKTTMFFAFLLISLWSFGQFETPYYEDLTIPVTSSKLYGSKMPEFDMVKNDSNKSHGVFTYWFDDITEEELFFSVQIPHKWEQGSAIHPHVHWIAPTDLNNKNVVWGMEYTWANVGDVFNHTTIIYCDTNKDIIKNPVAYQHLLSQFDSIPGNGKRISSMLLCRVFRAVELEEDNYEYEAGLLQIDFHYKLDSPGSKELLKK